MLLRANYRELENGRFAGGHLLWHSETVEIPQLLMLAGAGVRIFRMNLDNIWKRPGASLFSCS